MSDAALSDHTSIVETAASHIAERGVPVVRCANCETSIIGPYCSICGQERDTHRRSVAGLLRDFFVDLVNVDSRIMRTIYALLFMPGELSCAFREGRTMRYLPAMRLYLFTSLIFFLLLSATNLALMQLEVTATPVKVVYDSKGNAYLPNPAYNKDDAQYGIKPLIPLKKDKLGGNHYTFSTKVHFFQRIGAYHSQLPRDAEKRILTMNGGDDGKKPTKAQEAWMEQNIFGTMRRLVNDPAALNGPLTTWIPRVLFLLLPGYALVLMLFYFRKRKDYYFVDHLVFSLNIHTFGFVLLLLAAADAQIMRGEYVAFGMVIIATIYTFLAMKRFYRQGWIWTGVKFVSVSFIYVCFLALPALGIAVALSVFGGSLAWI